MRDAFADDMDDALGDERGGRGGLLASIAGGELAKAHGEALDQ